MSFAFFRKYNKIILAVGGSLLMVIFLIPQAASSFIGQPSDVTIGRIGKEQITLRDRHMANAEMQFIAQLNPQVAGTLPRGNDAPLAWRLMVEEARQQGLYGSNAQSQQLLTAWQVSNERLAQLKAEFKADDAFIYQALRHWQMVVQLQQMVLASRRVSEPAMRVFARDVQSQVSVKLVPIEAERMIDDVDEPTEAELQDRFQLNRNDLPGRGEPYGFGYRLPNRVKLEYIAVPIDRVRASVTVDEVEANRYYLEHTEQFVPEVEGVLPDVEVPPSPYREVRRRIIEQLTDRKTEEKMQRIVKTILAELDQTTRTYEREDSGYLVVGRVPDLEPIVEQIQRDYGVLPSIVRIEDRWVPINEIADLDGIGESYLIVGSGANRRAISTAQYINTTRELIPAGAANPLASLRLQEDVPSQPVQDIEGNQYIFRVLETEPSHPAESLAEVRERVVEDVKLLKAYGLIKRNAEQYVQSAREKGLEDFAGTISEETQVQTIEAFSRRDVNPQVSPEPVVPDLPVVGRSEQFVDGVFALAAAIDQAGALEAVPEDQRIGAVPVDRQLTVYITKITDYVPVTSDQFAQFRPFYGQFLEQEDMLYVRRQGVNPFSLDALATRVGYTPADEDEPRAPDDRPAEDNAAE